MSHSAVGTATPASPTINPREPHRRRSGTRRLIWFLVPAAVFYLFVTLVPSAQSLRYAFTSWDGVSTAARFTGLTNFANILSDPVNRGSVAHTLLIAVLVTVLQNGFGLLLALGAHAKIRSKQFVRVVLFAPAVVAPLAVAYLWKFLLGPSGGVNSIARAVGLSGDQDWLGNPRLVLISVVVVIVWQFSGYSMVIFSAGLESIPPELVEAAAVDGAGTIATFWHITRPLLLPAFTVNIVLTVVGSLKIFEQVLVMTNGGPANSSETMSTLIYKNAFQYGFFGLSIAMGVVLTIFVAGLSLAQYRLLNRKVDA